MIIDLGNTKGLKRIERKNNSGLEGSMQTIRNNERTSHNKRIYGDASLRSNSTKSKFVRPRDIKRNPEEIIYVML